MATERRETRLAEDSLSAPGAVAVARRIGAGTRKAANWVQLVKFGLVGVSNTVLALAVYALLVKGLGLWYVAASAIAFALGAVNGYVLNRSWTFSGHASDAGTALRWAVVQGSGLLLNLGLVYLLVDGAGLDKLVGQALAIVIVVVLAFFANRAWTFRGRPHLHEEHEVAPRVVAPHAGTR